jgi:hypothetical protein
MTEQKISPKRIEEVKMLMIREDNTESSTLICICEEAFTWEGYDKELNEWVAQHAQHYDGGVVPSSASPFVHANEKVTSIAQILQEHFEGKSVRRLRGRQLGRVKGVEIDEQISCATIYFDNHKSLLLFFDEKFVIAETKED